MQYLTAGESHGQALTVILSGMPAGVPVSSAAINADLARRQCGHGRGGRMAIEKDSVRIISGLRFGRTLGSPIALEIGNRDWPNWEARMSPEGAPPPDLAAELAPRPGHADLVGALKMGMTDCRNVLERSSARETAARVAAGALAKALLAAFGVELSSYVTGIGTALLPADEIARKAGQFSRERIESSPVRCPHEPTTALMMAAIDAAKSEGASLGGTFNVVATGLVCGIGSYMSGPQRLGSRLGAAVLGIPAIKGVEFGMGFSAARLPGNEAHDPIVRSDDPGRIQPVRASNNAGGLEGGMTTGEPLVIHAAMKPIPTMASPLPTVDLATGAAVLASTERSDVCAVPAAAVVAEAEVALVLADAYTEKFGHDSLADCLAAFESYVGRISTLWKAGS
jgi:chorismate synthase